MKKVCALTMVRNDDFFLRKWVSYYGQELGKENLYIFFDGTDQQIPDFCNGTHVVKVDKIAGKVIRAEKGRLRFLSEQAALLLEQYDAVIGTDADEFVIPDPKLKMNLVEFVSQFENQTSISALGVDMGQHLQFEKEININRPFLSQRRYGVLSTRYTKPSIIFKSVRWGSGFHRVKWHNFHLQKDLYLFHFGYFDLKRIEDRFNDKDRASAGWGKHLKRRARTIHVVSRKKALDWDKWAQIGRILQTYVRPPYAWNKPAMFNVDIVVKVPERFSKIV